MCILRSELKERQKNVVHRVCKQVTKCSHDHMAEASSKPESSYSLGLRLNSTVKV